MRRFVSRSVAAPPLAAAQLLAQGFEAHQRHDLAAAEELYRRVVALEPRNAHALHLLGLTQTQTGRLAQGLATIDRALALKPDFLDALNSRGNALQALGRPEDALAAYAKALALNPRAFEARVNAAAALRALGRHDEALQACDHALALKPQSAEAHYSRGLALAAQGRLAEAVPAYQRATALRSGHVDALYALGDALRRLGRLDAAVAACDRALATAPGHAGAHNSRGDALQALGRLDEARAAFDRALAAAPSYADAVFNRGLIALADGDFAAGWPAYEYRWRVSTPVRRALDPPQPLWRGEPLEGRSLLVYEEQGLGDVIQFCRYVPLLEKRGARVTLYVRPRMVALLRGRLGGARVIAHDPQDESFDWQCPIASLPLAFATELASIPADVPYLAAEPQRVEAWRERIGADGFRVGVAWAGSELGRTLGKCFPPEMLTRLARIPGVRLISLQRDAGPPPAGVETLGPEFDAGPDAFLDTAAAMAHLDLVVSVDTSIAHLAGALGRPVWVALPQAADWRWLRERADSPWYPTLRLFRHGAGGWDGVFAAIERALRAAAG
jgi:tetratricopeptide (TPR) repeat protein